MVDTPGFGDTDNDDEALIEEMMDVLSHTIDHADTIILLLKGDDTRFSNGLQKMIKRLTVMFGQSWWDYLVIVVSFWPYDQDSIDDRECFPDYPEYCKDEAWYAAQINAQILEKFGVDKNFTYVFSDSWSQTPGPPGFNTDDPIQQQHWQEETTKLWDITTGREEAFGFMTIDDILEENAAQRAEIKWLNDVITTNISKLAGLIQDNADNLGLVSGRVTVNDAHISQTNLRIDEGEAKIALSLHPVGSIISWLGAGKSLVSLPLGWQLCDGSTIMHGALAGQATPDLNNAGLFLRGGVEAAVGEVEQDAVQQHHHVDAGHTHTVRFGSSCIVTPCTRRAPTHTARRSTGTTSARTPPTTIKAWWSPAVRPTRTRTPGWCLMCLMTGTPITVSTMLMPQPRRKPSSPQRHPLYTRRAQGWEASMVVRIAQGLLQRQGPGT